MAETALPRINVSRKTGTERFRLGNATREFDLLSFWQWSASDLASNALRGRLAEFLVAQALGLADGVRAEWDACDLVTADGLKIEVKSASYLQTWRQSRPSAISFSIRPTRSWSADTNRFDTESKRQADIYVFALLDHKDKATLDPMDLSQWTFFVLPASVLNARLPAQGQVSLSVLLTLQPVSCRFDTLRDAITVAAKPAR